MLRTDTVQDTLLELLTRLEALPALQQVRLVGGTALALQIGHRSSIDLDLSGALDETTDHFALMQQLETLGNLVQLNRSESILTCAINGLKVDIVNYPYPWLDSPKIVDGHRLAQLKDIAAMKLAAITARGSRKDFIDIFFLMEHFSLEQMLTFFEQKYKGGSRYLVLKSLTWFDDAKTDPMPVMHKHFDWENLQTLLREEVTRIAVQ
jgi:hypothetical protein